jgi:hypothetical protein
MRGRAARSSSAASVTQLWLLRPSRSRRVRTGCGDVADRDSPRVDGQASLSRRAACAAALGRAAPWQAPEPRRLQWSMKRACPSIRCCGKAAASPSVLRSMRLDTRRSSTAAVWLAAPFACQERPAQGASCRSSCLDATASGPRALTLASRPFQASGTPKLKRSFVAQRRSGGQPARLSACRAAVLHRPNACSAGHASRVKAARNLTLWRRSKIDPLGWVATGGAEASL